MAGVQREWWTEKDQKVQEGPRQKPDLVSVGALYESAYVIAVRDRLHESNKHTSIIFILKYLVISFV